MMSKEPALIIQDMSLLQNQYGPMFGTVIAELQDAGLSPQVTAAYSIAQSNPALGTDLIGALRIKDSDIQSQFNTQRGMPWSQVENEVAGVFMEFVQSQTRLAPERLPSLLEIQGLFTKAAAQRYLSDSSRDIRSIAQDMYGRSIGEMIDVRETYYIPKTSMKGEPIDTKRRARDLENALKSRDWLMRNKVSTQFPIDDVMRFGKWQTLADGSGVRLVIERTTGIVPVKRRWARGGNDDFIITFDEMARSGPLGIKPGEDKAAEDVAEVMKRVVQ
jgi:hypothetical protein